MTQYIYPHDLKASANLWLWSLRDFAILCVGLLISVLALTQLRLVLPFALTAAYAFLSIRLERNTVLDYIRSAGKYLLFSQQEYVWGQRDVASDSRTYCRMNYAVGCPRENKGVGGKMFRIKRKGNSTRALMGLEGFTNYGIRTTNGELAALLVQPTNISVLSHANVEVKILHLRMVLSHHPELEISCLDSCEKFDDNKRFIKQRLQEEDNPDVRGVLEQEIGYLESKQVEMSTARQFLFILRFTKGEKPEQVFQTINSVMSSLSGEGFEARRMDKDDLKRVLGLYLETSMAGEAIEDVDGAKNFKKEGMRDI